MSYDMALMCGDDICETEPHTEGAIYCMGGVSECELSITGNYSRIYNFRQLVDMTGAESLPVLQRLVRNLGTERDADYWARTPGNVGYAASVLLGWASAHPDGVWRET